MKNDMRCGPAIRIRYLKGWSALLAATVVGVALLVLVVYDGSPARAQTNTAVLVGAGDIASCDSAGDRATARLLGNIRGTVFAVGDNVYDNGSLSEFKRCYGPTWGRHKARTKPVVGNAEYSVPRASGYFNYFGAAAGVRGKGYYSYNRGAWHIVALNSECDHLKGGCRPRSPMLTWLKRDLRTNPAACTLAYFHRPFFSSGNNGNQEEMRPIWDVLYASKADVVVGGHDHVYERFARQTPSGALSVGGIRQFVVGTGGKSHGKFPAIQPHSQARNGGTFGVLKLTLRPTNYSWKFVPTAGRKFTDSGDTNCRR
jgi:hypothetical protein